VADALRRLKKRIWSGNRWPVYLPKPGRRHLGYYEKPSALARDKEHFAQIRRQNNLNRVLNELGVSAQPFEEP
jgi:hypothetical protein